MKDLKPDLYRNHLESDGRNKVKIGLVLSGGGARGAYEVGVMKYMSEIGMFPGAYSGNSIGALNGMILAGSDSFSQGVQNLLDIWENINSEDMLKIDMLKIDPYTLISLALLVQFPQFAILIDRLKPQLKEFIPFIERSHKGLLDETPIRNLLENVNITQTVPLWVALYPAQGSTIKHSIMAAFQSLAAKLKLTDWQKPHFIKIQSLEPQERVEAILGSAALPILFAAKVIDGKPYVDGGLSGLEGNTPITPLIEKEHCQVCIVTHLTDGSLWDRNSFPDSMITEIRPQKLIHPEGLAKTIMNFSGKRIAEWIEQGYEDAKICIGDVVDWLDLVYRFNKAKERQQKAMTSLVSPDKLDME